MLQQWWINPLLCWSFNINMSALTTDNCVTAELEESEVRLHWPLLSNGILLLICHHGYPTVPVCLHFQCLADEINWIVFELPHYSLHYFGALKHVASICHQFHHHHHYISFKAFFFPLGFQSRLQTTDFLPARSLAAIGDVQFYI